MFYNLEMGENWLNKTETQAWRGFHALRTDLISHLARELVRECGLSESEYRILVVVSEAPDRRIRARDLCQALGWERSRLSRQISRMENRGTVQRVDCESDARGFDVRLTPSGLATITAAAPIQLQAVRHCFIDLLTTEQMNVLSEISEIVGEHLASEHSHRDDLKLD